MTPTEGIAVWLPAFAVSLILAHALVGLFRSMLVGVTDV